MNGRVKDLVLGAKTYTTQWLADREVYEIGGVTEARTFYYKPYKGFRGHLPKGTISDWFWTDIASLSSNDLQRIADRLDRRTEHLDPYAFTLKQSKTSYYAYNIHFGDLVSRMYRVSDSGGDWYFDPITDRWSRDGHTDWKKESNSWLAAPLIEHYNYHHGSMRKEEPVSEEKTVEPIFNEDGVIHIPPLIGEDEPPMKAIWDGEQYLLYAKAKDQWISVGMAWSHQGFHSTILNHALPHFLSLDNATQSRVRMVLQPHYEKNYKAAKEAQMNDDVKITFGGHEQPMAHRRAFSKFLEGVEMGTIGSMNRGAIDLMLAEMGDNVPEALTTPQARKTLEVAGPLLLMFGLDYFGPQMLSDGKVSFLQKRAEFAMQDAGRHAAGEVFAALPSLFEKLFNLYLEGYEEEAVGPERQVDDNNFNEVRMEAHEPATVQVG